MITRLRFMRNIWVVLALCMVSFFAYHSESHGAAQLILQVDPFVWDIKETATFTLDDWLEEPNLWNITITSTEVLTDAYLHITLYSGRFGLIVDGKVYLRGDLELIDGKTRTIYNSDVAPSDVKGPQAPGYKDFKDAVLKTGFLPDDTYTFTFDLFGKKEGELDFSHIAGPQVESMKITTPRAPVLISPPDRDENVGSFPTFLWEQTDVRSGVNVTYTLRLYEMFDREGIEISTEDAISRIPIWIKEVENLKTVDFDVGESSEEFICGRKYVWQVQAVDVTGRYVGSNQGRSEIWIFTIQYANPDLSQPSRFNPLVLNWTPAQSCGGQITYNLYIDDELDFIGAFEVRELQTTSYTYPDEAEPLFPGRTYHVKLLTIDEESNLLGIDQILSFQMPPLELELTGPPEGEVLSVMQPMFTWICNQPVGSFLVRVFESGSDIPIWEDETELPQLVYDGDPLGLGMSYEWEVQALDLSGNPYTVIGVRSTFSTQQLEVTIDGPAGNRRISNLTPTFSWSTNITIPSFLIEVYPPGQQDSPIISEEVSTAPFIYSGSDIENNSRYEWTVRALNDIGEIIPSDYPVESFRTPQQEQITLTSPDGASDVALKPTFTLEPLERPSEAAEALRYILEITGPDGSVIHTAETENTEYTYPSDAPELEYATTYEWTVEARIGNAVHGQRSNAGVFTTIAAPVIVEEEISFEQLSEVIQEAILDALQAAVASGSRGAAQKIQALSEELQDFSLVSATMDGQPITAQDIVTTLEDYRIIDIVIE